VGATATISSMPLMPGKTRSVIGHNIAELEKPSKNAPGGRGRQPARAGAREKAGKSKPVSHRPKSVLD
jgi:hypothetical protein